MEKIIDNPDGTHSMHGFSNKNPEDMKEIANKFFPQFSQKKEEPMMPKEMEENKMHQEATKDHKKEETSSKKFKRKV